MAVLYLPKVLRYHGDRKRLLSKEDVEMPGTVRMEIQSAEIIDAVKRMKKKQRDSLLEDLLAATSPEYLESIKEARRHYKAGRVKTHDAVFGR